MRPRFSVYSMNGSALRTTEQTPILCIPGKKGQDVVYDAYPTLPCSLLRQVEATFTVTQPDWPGSPMPF
jgi:hypothetical protein